MTGFPTTGETLGPYRLVRRIGGGGMGVVLEAYDESLRRPVALKVIAPHLAEDPGFRARFTREAQALASLDSAHVVPVYAHGEHAGRLYLATPLFPDGDLARLLLEEGPPPLPVALDLVAQVADGLADAHAAGLVHRDLKPGNVLLRRRDGALSAYLTDFGISRRLDADHTRTRGAGTAGTPSFMAPELHLGGTASVASDVYSLGCLLWTTLTGRVPYPGESDYQVMTAHLEAPVPQLAGDGAAVREVNRILRRALAKDPAARHASAAELRDDLRRARALPAPVSPVVVAGEPSRWAPARTRVLAAAAAAVVLLVAGGLGYAATRGDGDGAAGDADAPAGSAPASPASSATAPDGDGGSGGGGGGGAGRPTAADRARATTSLARALERQGLLTADQARCTAERWIGQAGLRAMREAGFFTADWDFVDQDRSAMTPAIEAAATTAALACATP